MAPTVRGTVRGTVSETKIGIPVNLHTPRPVVAILVALLLCNFKAFGFENLQLWFWSVPLLLLGCSIFGFGVFHFWFWGVPLLVLGVFHCWFWACSTFGSGVFHFWFGRVVPLLVLAFSIFGFGVFSTFGLSRCLFGFRAPRFGLNDAPPHVDIWVCAAFSQDHGLLLGSEANNTGYPSASSISSRHFSRRRAFSTSTS